MIGDGDCGEIDRHEFTFSVGHEEVPSALNLLCTALQPSGFWIYLQKMMFILKLKSPYISLY
jgi:hypothetical protein